MSSARLEKRNTRAIDGYKAAVTDLYPIEHGMHVFAVTRGQWSMVDAVLASLDAVASSESPAHLSIWTWCIASYEVDCIRRLMLDRRISLARLLIDRAGSSRDPDLMQAWRDVFGPESIRVVVNHAKIATIETAEYRLLLRGSMNLNYNPRYEQFDMTEGGPDFDLVRSIEDSLPILHERSARDEVTKVTGLSDAHTQETLNLFAPRKVWAK